MEELARMVAASMDRHGCDTSIDHRRLNWSPWFRCELNVDLLLIPSAPGIFALAEEVIPGAKPESVATSLDGETLASTSSATTTNSLRAMNTYSSFDISASQSGGDSARHPGNGSAHQSGAGNMQAGHDHSRRLLAVFEIGETHDLGSALLRLFAPGSALRDRLRSGRCFARFTPVADGAQRHAAAISLREWLIRSAAVDGKPLVGAGSAA